MVKLVQQEDDYGCGVAGLAMALGVPYKQARKEVQLYWNSFRPFDKWEGLGHDDEKIVLFKHGFKVFDIRPVRKGVYLKKYIRDCKALLTVPSINAEGLFHSLYWDGKKMHDPSKLKTYTEKKAWLKCRSVRVVAKCGELHDLFGISGRINYDEALEAIRRMP